MAAQILDYNKPPRSRRLSRRTKLIIFGGIMVGLLAVFAFYEFGETRVVGNGVIEAKP
jgi:hypothetical protein